MKGNTLTDLPALRHRLVGAARRAHRISAGLTIQDAADILDSDPSKISRIETGVRGIRRKELRELLTEYGAPDEDQETLAALARPGKTLPSQTAAAAAALPPD